MGSRILAGLFCALSLTLAGCFETRQVITLNPDGSGKVVMDTVMAPQAMMMMAATSREASPRSDAVAREMAAGMIRDSKGVDAWSDVGYEAVKGGKVHITATAYFRDYSKVCIDGHTVMEAAWAPAPGGGMVLDAGLDRCQGGKASSTSRALSAGELDDLVKLKRQEWQMARPTMVRVLGELKIDAAYVLPGKVVEANLYERTDQGVRLRIDGSKILRAIDAIVADDAQMKEELKAGRDPTCPLPSGVICQRLFGQSGPIRAKVGGELKPLFDYKAEVEKAKAAEPALMKKLSPDAVWAGQNTSTATTS